MLKESTKNDIREAYSRVVKGKKFVPRQGQRQMIAEIAKSLGALFEPDPGEEVNSVCVVEAGTGIGKTLAYMAAAIPIGLESNKKIIISTATIALQEQLVSKDLPEFKEHSGVGFDFLLLKGRRRYVCLSKLDLITQGVQNKLSSLPMYPDEVPITSQTDRSITYEAMIDSLAIGKWDGDLDNWEGSLEDNEWRSITADHNECTGRRCPNISNCYFFRARDGLEDADVLVTNYNLLLTDLISGGNGVLPSPEDSIYIFDEGHHLPDKALAHFQSASRLKGTALWLRETRKILNSEIVIPDSLDEMRRSFEIFGELTEQIEQKLLLLLDIVPSLMEVAEKSRFSHDRNIRFSRGLIPEKLSKASLDLHNLILGLIKVISKILGCLERHLENNANSEKGLIEDLHLAVNSISGRVNGLHSLWESFSGGVEKLEYPYVRWISEVNYEGKNDYIFHSSPLMASDLLKDIFWSRAAGVVVTSATIRSLNSFKHFVRISGAPAHGVYKVISSPFDYSKAKFVVPEMDSQPSDAEAHSLEIINLLPNLLNLEQATLVLFSSRRQMIDVYSGLQEELKEIILMQGDLSKFEMLRIHCEKIDDGVNSAIFGLTSFSEGIDLPSHYCQHVIIAKIPFAVPDDPVGAAFSEWIDDSGGNSFMQFSVPEASLRLVQASGRLIRTEEDVGRVTLLDRRIVTRYYGRAILDSLPRFSFQLNLL